MTIHHFCKLDMVHVRSDLATGVVCLSQNTPLNIAVNTTRAHVLELLANVRSHEAKGNNIEYY